MANVIEIEPVPGWKGRVQHGQRMTLTSYDIAEVAPDVHEHHHPEEEAWTVSTTPGCSGPKAARAASATSPA